jgi:hypothetical protein
MQKESHRTWLTLQLLGMNLPLLFVLSACSQPQNTQPVLACHQWSKTEGNAIAEAVEALPDNSPLIAPLEDYKRLCANLG